jgi:PAP2 superfamily
MAARGYCRVMATTVVVFICSFGTSVWPQGFPRGHRDAWGPRYKTASRGSQTPRRQQVGADSVRRWNEIALNANALDHVPVAPEGPEQFGPLRTARAFAIVHIAIFDAVNAIVGGYKSYTGLSPAHGASMNAAVAQAAHDTLVDLFPSQTINFDALLAEDLSKIRDGRAKTDGIDLGQQAAAAILALRANDGSQHDEELYGDEYMPAAGLGKWRQDPISQIPIALGSRWAELVTPFVLMAANQFPVPPPPAPNTSEYAAAFNEVKNYGGCGDDPVACEGDFGGSATPTMRTLEQTQIGIYWGYDGTPGLGTPPRLYNQIAMQIAEQNGSDAVELARLLALINVAMADAGLACWETKYREEFWRPITGIRKAADYGNSDTLGDVNWTPLGAPASNKIGPDFTPPFPAYTSGHATFGAAMFETLRKFYRTDRISFTFVSDEFNGVTRDNQGIVRPLIARSFKSLSEAEEENGQSRIYLGIHWAFDKSEGILQGRKVGDHVFANAFTPLYHSR